MGSNSVPEKKKENEGKCRSKNMVSFWSKDAVCCNRLDAEEVGSNFMIILLYGLGHCPVNKAEIIMHALPIGYECMALK